MKRLSPRYIVLIVVALGIIGFIYRFMQGPVRNARASNCFSNLRQIGLATMQYTRDHDQKYPVAARWTDDLQPYVEIGEKERTAQNLDRSFRCATTGDFYVLNAFLADSTLSDGFDAANLPLAFCARASERNLADNGSLWPLDPIHNMGSRWGNIVVFADARVKMTKDKPQFRALSSARTKPIARPELTKP